MGARRVFLNCYELCSVRVSRRYMVELRKGTEKQSLSEVQGAYISDQNTQCVGTTDRYELCCAEVSRLLHEGLRKVTEKQSSSEVQGAYVRDQAQK